LSSERIPTVVVGEGKYGNSGMMDDISLRGSPKEYRRKHLSGVDNTWYLDEETWG